MSQLTEEDKKLFAQAMQGVAPQKPSDKIPAITRKPKLKPKRKQEYLETAENHPSHPYLEIHQAPVTAHQSLSYFQTGTRPQDQHLLKTGKIQITARLDLHGYTEDTALEKLKKFIQTSHNNGHKYLLLIHGKGYNSDTNYPTIKNLIHQFLPNFSQVLGYTSAQQKDGGTGAVYIWLKRS